MHVYCVHINVLRRKYVAVEMISLALGTESYDRYALEN